MGHTASSTSVLRHRLTEAELTSLASGRLVAATVSRLTAAERSKHLLLVEAVRRRAKRERPASDVATVESAIRLLGDIEAQSPDIIAKLLTLPQIGSWAVSCLRRMGGGGNDESDVGYDASLRGDLGYLAGIAATAALRVCHPFELTIPVQNGNLFLPSLGVVHIDCGRPWDNVRVRLDHNGAMATCTSGMIRLPAGNEDGRCFQADGCWSLIPHLYTRADDLEFDVALDAYDPFLAHVGEAVVALSAAEQAAWQSRLDDAWRILVRHHRATAEAIAAMVSTLVPLAARDSRPTSATSGWAFGAIGLGLPGDGLLIAETLVHELQHLVLGAVEDFVQLVNHDRDDRLYYAPWRDDPRPAAALLHGCYAYLGVTAFWRRQRLVGGPAQMLCGAVEFARWRRVTLDAATMLAGSPALTKAGVRFAAGIRRQLAHWQNDAVPADAERMAAEVSTEHRVRWRLAHLRPTAAVIDTLACAWRSRASLSLTDEDIGVTLEPSPRRHGQPLQFQAQPGQLQPQPSLRPPRPRRSRADLLQARHRDPVGLARTLHADNVAPEPTAPVVEEADAALLRGNDLTAARCYLQRLEANEDKDAWAGLAVVLGRAGPPTAALLLTERPEIAVALHAYLRSHTDEAPNVGRMLDWLARALLGQSQQRRLRF